MPGLVVIREMELPAEKALDNVAFDAMVQRPLNMDNSADRNACRSLRACHRFKARFSGLGLAKSRPATPS
ncbi:MAG: hypothetical protein LBW85_00895 [Deltaproteobacteria bacterium]|nr:hypothetical protein [Deltaproteobacteria bacterium]